MDDFVLRQNSIGCGLSNASYRPFQNLDEAGCQEQEGSDGQYGDKKGKKPSHNGG